MEHTINLAAGHFHSPRFFYGDEQITNLDVASWDLKEDPNSGYRIVSDLISLMNANGSGYSTDYIWVKLFSKKFHLSISIKIFLQAKLQPI